MTTDSGETTPETEKTATETAPEAGAAAADPLSALKAENDQLRDQLLRTLAEMENLRRRTEREVQDAGRYAITGFAREVL
ncbi:nucleotide exchange factor GrpE, partial [Pseudoxanthobacter sp.]|uniref:nucleotide exchange factor GrpE n=1 Tax=Pseudoxanthobacter sp. TaxID=1925742 RepID=UPI002FDF2798